MADYISREAMHKANQDEWQGVYGFVDCDIFEDNENMIDRVPSADVRPVAEISDAVYEAMYFLNSVSAQMPYHVYSALFDLILGILPTCGADMLESNLDTTKVEGRDESSG